YAGAGRARQVSRRIPDAPLPGPRALSRYEGCFVGGTGQKRAPGRGELSGFRRSGAQGRVRQHDLSGVEPERLRERRGEVARRGFTADVSESTDRSHHEWSTRRHLDFRTVSRFIRPPYSVVARGQLQPAWSPGAAAGGSLGGAPSGETRFTGSGAEKDRTQAGPGGLHDRVCAPRNRLQA